MSKRFGKIFRVLLVCMVIYAGYGHVLCSGHDGHIAIEPVLHHHCDGETGHHHEAPESHSDCRQAECCKPCVDIPLGNEFDPARHQSSLAATLNHLPVIIYASQRPSLNLLQRGVASPPPFYSPLRTIILLT